MTKTCGAETADGGACGVAFGLCDKCGRCWSHCAHRREEADAARRRGGITSAKKKRGPDVSADPSDAPPAPRTMADAVDWASWTARAVAVGELSERRAREVTSAIREFRQGLEKASLAAEIGELRETVERLKGRRGE